MVEALVVDDSKFMRVQIREILEEGGISVIGEAHNGKAAVDAVHELEPDVVTMDVKMPGMDGIEAVERIMESQPVPILMLSRYTADGSDTTFEALDAGAVDFFVKPGGEVSTTLVQYADELVDTIEAVAAADVEVQPRASAVDERAPDRPSIESATAVADSLPTLVIAASTGGPTAVESVLGALPADIGLRVLVVQHMPAQFTERFAQRLERTTAYSVREAGQRDAVGQDEALIARGGSHLLVTNDTGQTLSCKSTRDPPVHSVRPAADVTFQSVAEHATGPLVGVVLTGMGRDGAVGITSVNEAGGKTIVQDPDEASISSMPQRAIDTGAIDAICPTDEIPSRILEAIDTLQPTST